MGIIGGLGLSDINFDSLDFKATYQLLSILNSNDLTIEDKESVTYHNTKLFKQALSNHLHRLSNAIREMPENKTLSVPKVVVFRGILKDGKFEYEI